MKQLLAGLGLLGTLLLPATGWAAAVDRFFSVEYDEPTTVQNIGGAEFRAFHSDKCLTLRSDGLVTQETCTNSPTQIFERVLITGSGNVYRLKANSSALCLAVGNNGSAANGTVIEPQVCSASSAAQQFQINTSPSTIRMNNGTANPGQCLDVKGVSQSDGAAVQQFQCNGGSNQLWAWSTKPPGGAAVDDLALTMIYTDVITDGMPAASQSIPATAATGGGHVNQGVCVQVLDDTTGLTIDVWVTAVDQSGNEGAATGSMTWTVAGNPDCDLPPDPTVDSTPPTDPGVLTVSVISTLVTSENCLKSLSIVDAGGHLWTFSSSGQTLRDGVDVFGTGSYYFFADGLLYVFNVSGHWFRYEGPGANIWTDVGTVAPVCGCFSATTVVDSDGATWTLDVDFHTLRDGEWIDNGIAVGYKWVGGANGSLYAQFVNDNWYHLSVQPEELGGAVFWEDTGPGEPSCFCEEGTTLTDSGGNVWTFSLQEQTLRNGIWVGGGYGRNYLLTSEFVYHKNLNGNWYHYDAVNVRWFNDGIMKPVCK